MIKYLRIKNFKCLDDIELVLSNLTLLTGANGAGKSSVIQSLLLLRQSWCDKVVDLRSSVKLDGDLVDLIDAPSVLNVLAKSPLVTFELVEEKQDTVSFSFDALTPERTPAVTISGDYEAFVAASPLFKDSFVYLYADRSIPLKRYHRIAPSPTDSSVGDRQGNNAAFRLFQAISNNEKIRVPELCFPGVSDLVVTNVSAWLSYIVGWPLFRIGATQETKDDVSIKYYSTIADGFEKEMSPVNVAFGNSYIFPIVLASLLAEQGSLLIIENPEAHLHPAAQTRMGRFLSLMAQSGIQLIVESHSDHLMNGIRLSVKNHELSADNFEVFYLDANNGVPVVNRIVVEEDGDIRRWPNGFFDEWENALLQLSK